MHSTQFRYRIVGFIIEPFSVKHVWDGDYDSSTTLSTCSSNGGIVASSVASAGEMILKVNNDRGPEILYTYDVVWTESDVEWASRWDIYLSSEVVQDNVHWFNILNAVLVVIFLTGVLAIVLARTLYKDMEQYNRVRTEEELEEEAEERGWKLVHADVFRPPVMPGLFCALIGSAAQMFGMVCVFMPIAALGFVSPANRGSLLAGLLVMWLLMGTPAGFTSARLFKTFALKDKVRATLHGEKGGKH